MHHKVVALIHESPLEANYKNQDSLLGAPAGNYFFRPPAEDGLYVCEWWLKIHAKNPRTANKDECKDIINQLIDMCIAEMEPWKAVG